MGRRSAGYKLKLRGTIWSVRWEFDGHRQQITTGERDRGKAEKVARDLYAKALGGQRPKRQRRRHGASTQLDSEDVGEWLAAVAVRQTTRKLYEKYARGWLQDLPVLTEATIAAYIRQRLKEATGKSVRSELAALRGLVSWLAEQGFLAQVAIPRLPSAALGTPQPGHRVAAPHYTVDEIKALLAALPERSNRDGFLVQPRCRFLYETGLRPSTINALSVPEHWARGSKRLRITADIDKEGFAREVPVSKQGLAILGQFAPTKGLIFGPHRYDPFVREAAGKTLPKAKAGVFTSQHLRSARITHWLEAGMKLPAVQYLAGHKHASTTDRYVRPGSAVAERELSKLD